MCVPPPFLRASRTRYAGSRTACIVSAQLRRGVAFSKHTESFPDPHSRDNDDTRRHNVDDPLPLVQQRRLRTAALSLPLPRTPAAPPEYQ
ncbi:hypothetical protein DFH09DRAFT_1365651 [Mycena vulgaris]|nr:hypothetical protein DFH09DRAFT_1365651 [Mycena vulgaris]